MSISYLRSSVALATLVLLAAPVIATGPTFRADYVFSGSSIDKNWKSIGAADWKASNGQITGTPKSADGGWLILDQSFQDIELYADTDCPEGCKAGFLFRAEKTPDGGMKGIFASITPGDLNTYAITLDAQGKEISRTKLEPPRREGGPPAGAGAPVAGGLGGVNPVPELPPGINLPKTMLRPVGTYNTNNWNTYQVILSQNTLTPSFNGGRLGQAASGPQAVATKAEYGNYGPVAIYVGGTKPLELKDFRWKDINKLNVEPEYISPNFKKLQLSEFYYSWSAAVADFNHDGIPDISAGPFIWYGPDFKTRREIYEPHSYDPTSQYPIPSMVSLAYDFTGDGWPDLLVMSGNAGNGIGTLYVNPKGENRRWDKFVVLPMVGNEETLLKDIDGDGRPDIIQAYKNQLAYSTYDPANPTAPWTTHIISEPGPWGANIGHGLGVGDINGDGRMDFVNVYGWWEQPPKGTTGLWKYHPQDFGRWGASQGGAGGAELAVYDVNGDGLVDVVGPMEGHGYGLAWWEQKRDATGNISFVTHVIMDNFLTKNAGDVTFTEPHAAAFADIDGDGLLDMVTGKRAMSHFGYSDPDPFGPAVTYVYFLRRNKNAPGGAEFVPELVHNQSGVGSHLVVADVNNDGKPDIITSGIYGTFVFLNQEKKK
jgi:hypothetical protein